VGGDQKRVKKFGSDDSNEAEIEAEHLRNLKILESVVKKTETVKKAVDSSVDRSKFSAKDEETLEKVPEKSSDQKYWVSSSLTQALSGTKKADNESTNGSFRFSGHENGSTGFSLLSKFGKVDDAEVDVGKYSGGSTKRSNLDNNPFKFDSSDDENDGENKNSIPGKDRMVLDPVDLFAQKLRERASASKDVFETFFFQRNDSRFEEGRLFFMTTESIDTMRTKHDENRATLAQIMKKKLKRKAKKQEKLSFDLKRTNKKGGIVKKKFVRGKKFNQKQH